MCVRESGALAEGDATSGRWHCAPETYLDEV